MYQVYKPRRGLKRSEDNKVNGGDGVRWGRWGEPGVNGGKRRQRGCAGCPGCPVSPLTAAPAPQETYKLPHRLIEKKRRDRINECIAQLKDLLPEHLKLTVGASGGTGQRLPRRRLSAAASPRIWDGVF